MSEDFPRARIPEEIDRVPEEGREAVLDAPTTFRESPPLLSFAGAWSDMDESDFEEFMKETERRRHRPF